MTINFPPRHIAILGALAILAGVSSVVSMIFQWVSGHTYVDFGFVGIVIGYGLLIGRSSSRKWALFFAGLGWLILTGLAVWLICDAFFSDGNMVAGASFLDWFGLVIVWSTSLYFWIVLRAEACRDWFASIKEDNTSQKTFAWAVAVVSLVFSFLYEFSHWQMYQTYQKMYPYQVTIVPYDEVSGEGMQSLESGALYSPLGYDKKYRFPIIQFGSSFGKDGMEIKLSGIATDAFEYTILSDGYKNKKILIERDTPKRLPVPMVRDKERKVED